MGYASRENPFPGLRPFEFSDRAFFFGRKAHILELHRKLVSNRFVAVVGTSGSGKSSLVKAGLFGHLHDMHHDHGSPNWQIVLLRPQGDPLHELARQLAAAKASSADEATSDQNTAFEISRAESRLQRSSLGLVELLSELPLNKGGRILIVVDQFEELFRYPYIVANQPLDAVAGLDQRALFVKQLLEASEASDQPFHVLITMRSEFLGDCTSFRGLPEAINDSQFLTPRLTRDQRREAIVGPIDLAEGGIAPALLQRLLNDVGNEPDQLPVLQHALMRTWGIAKPDRRLELAQYDSAGRLERSISNHANDIYTALEPRLQLLASRVFKSLTDVDREGREIRRPCRFTRLVGESGASEKDVQSVIDPFRGSDCAFIVPPLTVALTENPVVDISHEALIRKWDKLASGDDREGWVASEARDGRTYSRLLHVAEAHASDPAIVLSPAETRDRSRWWESVLPNVQWAERYGGKYPLVERLMTDSRDNAANEDRRRKMRWAGAAVAAAILLVVLGYGYAKERTAATEQHLRSVAEHSRGLAENARNDAERNADLARRAQKDAEDERDKVRAEIDRAVEAARGTRGTLETATAKDPGWLGLKVGPITAAPAGNRSPFGTIIIGVEEGSPAGRADFQPGDTIIAINAVPVTTTASFETEIARLGSGTNVALWRMRDGQPAVPVALTLAARPTTEVRVGIDYVDVTGAEAGSFGWDAPRGAKIIRVVSGSPAEKAGFKVGDVILHVDGIEVDTADRLEAALESKRAGTQVRFRILSSKRERIITLVLGEGTNLASSSGRDVPRLMLDTGGHMAVIKGLAFTPDGKQLLSAGDDKVIRVWDWQAGKTVRAIRGQVGPGHEGKIFAMALAPNGRHLAVGGWMHSDCGDRCGEIRHYDFATGQLVALLRGHTNVVTALTFSADSSRLISASADKTAIVWDIGARRPIHQLKGHTDAIYAAAFTSDGERVVTGSLDSSLKVWTVRDGKMASTISHQAGVRVLATSPTSRLVAAGDLDGEIRLWDVSSGRLVRSLGKQRGRIGALAFDETGNRLIATCGGGLPCSDIPQTVWDVNTGQVLSSYRGHRSLVPAIATKAGAGFLAATADFNGEIHLWNSSTGAASGLLKGTGTSSWSVGFSTDGTRIAWGNTYRLLTANDRAALEFQARLPSKAMPVLLRPERLNSSISLGTGGFTGAVTRVDNHALALRRGLQGDDAILDIVKDGKVTASIERGPTQGYRHLAYSFLPQSQTIISGGEEGNLVAYDFNGRVIGQFVGHESDVWALAPSPDGSLLVSAAADQTIRLWNSTSRELIATFFNATDGEWVMWTPQGYYMGSPGSDKIVGWQINKGFDNAADYVGADQLRQHLNRPDIVEKAILLASAERSVREAPGTTFKLADLLARPVPKFRILAPSPSSVVRGGRAIVKIDIEAVPDPIKAIRLQVNGRQVEEITTEVGSGGFSAGERQLDVPLSKGRNEIRVTLTNAVGESAQTLALVHENEGDLDKRGTLYILAIGVDKYPGLGNTCGPYGTASCDLRFSSADARLFVDAAERRLGPAHSKVVKRLLINDSSAADAPTAGNILDAIDILKQSRETDTVVLFIAGQGYNDGPSYRFLATNAERVGDAFRSATVISWQIIQEAVEMAKGRRLLFIDTCHSGNAYNQKLGNAAYHANIIAFTASRFDQEALEDNKLGHGLFTYAVVEGLEGKGLDGKRDLSTKDLADYVRRRVDELAKTLRGEQEPQYYKGRDAEDYVLVRW